MNKMSMEFVHQVLEDSFLLGTKLKINERIELGVKNFNLIKRINYLSE